jgi:uncharacterized protein YqeY
MPDLKKQFQQDLTTAMKQRDELTTSTLRMLLSAVTTEEVAGSEARELSDDEVIRVVNREARKRREAAEAFSAGNRPEQAQRELDEETVLARYLPAPLTEEELTALVAEAIAESGATTPRDMGLVMKSVQPKVAGRADGKRVSDEVKRQLAG